MRVAKENALSATSYRPAENAAVKKQILLQQQRCRDNTDLCAFLSLFLLPHSEGDKARSGLGIPPPDLPVRGVPYTVFQKSWMSSWRLVCPVFCRMLCTCTFTVDGESDIAEAMFWLS